MLKYLGGLKCARPYPRANILLQDTSPSCALAFCCLKLSLPSSCRDLAKPPAARLTTAAVPEQGYQARARGGTAGWETGPDRGKPGGSGQYTGPVSNAQNTPRLLGMGMGTAGVTLRGVWEGKAAQRSWHGSAVGVDVSLYKGNKWLDQCGAPRTLSSWLEHGATTSTIVDHSLYGPIGGGLHDPCGPFPTENMPWICESGIFVSSTLASLSMLIIGWALKGQRSSRGERRACAAPPVPTQNTRTVLLFPEPRQHRPLPTTAPRLASQPRAPSPRPRPAPLTAPTGFMAAARACCPAAEALPTRPGPARRGHSGPWRRRPEAPPAQRRPQERPGRRRRERSTARS